MRALGWALVLNSGFLFIELAIGLITGSLALLSDAVHMMSDVGALTLALGAAWLARQPARPSRSYGYRRAEVLGALINGVALLVACVFIVKEAIERLWTGPPEVSGWPVLAAGLIGLLINLASAWYLHRADSQSLNMRGALLHMLADAAGSFGAVVAAVFVLAGMPSADAIVSILLGLLIVWSGSRLLRDACHVLLEFVPRDVDIEHIQSALADLDGVDGVHDLHVWSLDGQTKILTVHLQACSTDVRARAARMLRARFAIEHTTIQLECEDLCVCTLAASPGH